MTKLADVDTLTEMLEHHKKDCNPDHFDGHETFIDKIDAHDGYGEWQFANGFNLGIVASIVEIKHAPTVDAEPTEEQVKEYCRKRCLVVVDSELLNEMKAMWSSVPVVRCKDCKYGEPNGQYGCKCYHHKLYETHEMSPNDFCSHAERREDETD